MGKHLILCVGDHVSLAKQTCACGRCDVFADATLESGWGVYGDVCVRAGVGDRVKSYVLAMVGAVRGVEVMYVMFVKATCDCYSSSGSCVTRTLSVRSEGGVGAFVCSQTFLWVCGDPTELGEGHADLAFEALSFQVCCDTVPALATLGASTKTGDQIF